MNFYRCLSVKPTKKTAFVVSDCGEYLTLPYKANSGITMKFKMINFAGVQYSAIFGDSWDNQSICLYYETSRLLQFRYGVSQSLIDDVGYYSFKIIEVEMDYVNNTLTVDGHEFGGVPKVHNDRNISLFGLANGHGASVGISDIEISINGEVVSRLIASPGGNGSGYFHDEINNINYFSLSGYPLKYIELETDI